MLLVLAGSVAVCGVVFAVVLVVLLGLSVLGLGTGELIDLSEYQTKVITVGLVLTGTFALVGLAWWIVLAGEDGLLG